MIMYRRCQFAPAQPVQLLLLLLLAQLSSAKSAYSVAKRSVLHDL